MKKIFRKKEGEFITIKDVENHQLHDDKTWTVETWVRFPPKTARSRIVEGWRKILRRVVSFFKRTA